MAISTIAHVSSLRCGKCGSRMLAGQYEEELALCPVCGWALLKPHTSKPLPSISSKAEHLEGLPPDAGRYERAVAGIRATKNEFREWRAGEIRRQLRAGMPRREMERAWKLRAAGMRVAIYDAIKGYPDCEAIVRHQRDTALARVHHARRAERAARRRKVARLLAEGLTVGLIAERLAVSDQTIRKDKRAIESEEATSEHHTL